MPVSPKFAYALFAAVILFSPVFVYPPQPLAADPDRNLGEILSSAESLFQAMRAQNYPAIWAGLTAESRKTIADEAGKAIAGSTGRKIEEADLRQEFEKGGPIASGYWIGFLTRFHPDSVLEESRWEPGTIEKDRAEILITHKSSSKPAQLKLFREGDSWKVGLVETFWGRK